MSKPNKLFARNGHTCEISSEMDPIARHMPGNCCLTRLRRCFLRARMISETNRRSLKHLRSQAKIYYEKEKHLTYYSYMIHPFSDLRMYWEFFMFFVIIIAFIVFPLNHYIYIYYQLPEKLIFYVRVVVLQTVRALLYVDVLATFFTGYWDRHMRVVELRPDLVAMHYLQTYFIPDIFATFPIHAVMTKFGISRQSHTTIILTFLRYLLIFRLCRMRTYGKRLALKLRIPPLAMGYLDLAISATLFIHMVVLINIHISVAYPNTASWSIFKDFLEDVKGSQPKDIRTLIMIMYSVIIKFARSGYSMSTEWIIVDVPYGRFVNEIIFLFLIVHFYSLYGLSLSKPKYDEMVMQLTEYMDAKRFPKYLQRRLLLYYEFRYQKSYFRESEILVAISGQLRQDLLMHSCNKLVSKVTFFKNIPIGLLIRIVTCLTVEVFLPNDVIIRSNTVGDCMYFIATGTVAVYTPLGYEVKHLEDGDHFGEISMVIPNTTRNASVVAVEICELYKLQRKDFVKAIMPYPDLLIKIEKIAKGRTEDTDVLNKQSDAIYKNTSTSTSID